MAKQIAKIFLPGSDVNTPVVIMLFWTQSTPWVAHPSPLKKKCREGHLVVKNGTMLHQLNYMGSTPPPPTGSTLPVWNTGDRLVLFKSISIVLVLHIGPKCCIFHPLSSYDSGNRTTAPHGKEHYSVPCQDNQVGKTASLCRWLS